MGKALVLMGASIIFAACKNLRGVEAALLVLASGWLVIGTWMATIGKISLQREQESASNDETSN